MLGMLLVWAPAQDCRNGEELAGWRFPLLPHHISPFPLAIYCYSFTTGEGESFSCPLLKSILSPGFDASRNFPVSALFQQGNLAPSLSTSQPMSFCNSRYEMRVTHFHSQGECPLN